MRDGPDISIIASLIGNPASASMLMALISGPALTATELANEARITRATASGHLAKLEKSGLVVLARQGRHHYFRLAGPEVVAALEALLPLAARAGHLRTRTGPRDPELRQARSCYDHLAGGLAVRMYQSYLERGLLVHKGADIDVTDAGRRAFARKGIDFAQLERMRRPLCRSCLDWSERQYHLSGALGAAIFYHFLQRGWAARRANSRIVRFAPGGDQKIAAWYRQ